MRQLLAVLAWLAVSSIWSAAADTQNSCQGLTSLHLGYTTITSAEVMEAGAFTPPAAPPSGAGAMVYKRVPAFCRVRADIRPSKDSDIKIEVWMPAAGWNGKYQGQGNGGFAGAIDYASLAGAVSRGYASAATDTGHAGDATDASWALGHPEKIVDFGYRGIHEMSEKAKAVVAAFYGAAPQYSYFSSCSDVAGAPANFWTHLVAGAAWDSLALLADPASYIPAAKLPAISAAAIASCDAQDGLADGIISDPAQCHFDPAQIQCKGPESDSCLTEPQVTALKKIYAGPQASGGSQIFPGYMPGGELGGGGWGLWITGSAPEKSLQFAFGSHFFADMVFEDANWDFRKFRLEQDTKLADKKVAAILNATAPDLRPFQKRGGKLIMYHGWSDAAISPVNSIHYYDSVVKKMGSGSSDFIRLFMAPGLQHCFMGPGPNSFGQGSLGRQGDPDHDVLSAVERWVESGVAPQKIIATKYIDDLDPSQGVKMTRPLCPYPQVASYNGTGDKNDAASFICTGTAPGH